MLFFCICEYTLNCFFAFCIYWFYFLCMTQVICFFHIFLPDMTLN